VELVAIIGGPGVNRQRPGVQKSCTSQLIFCVGGLVSYPSAITALATEDIIFTSTGQVSLRSEPTTVR
jgi:2-keto-4-pentenoate hydratase/2-oxohepta-3-ene-1,7-dioic acid hydratase in catechol pathway